LANLWKISHKALRHGGSTDQPPNARQPPDGEDCLSGGKLLSNMQRLTPKASMQGSIYWRHAAARSSPLADQPAMVPRSMHKPCVELNAPTGRPREADDGLARGGPYMRQSAMRAAQEGENTRKLAAAAVRNDVLYGPTHGTVAARLR
jgi:hypothetical protein